MKSISTLLVLLIALAGYPTTFAQEKVTKANYELPKRFSPKNMKRLVFSTRVDPHWMKNSNRFWYTYETAAGKNYYIVDPVRKSKSVMFVRDDLAAQMSMLTGDPFDGKHLSISNLKFINNETAIRYEVKSKLAEEDADEEEDGDDQDDKEKTKKGGKQLKTWFFEYDLASKNLRLLDDYEKPEKDKKWASISPDGSYVIYSKQHNLYWMDAANYAKALEDEKDSTIVETQWTTDGTWDYSYGSYGRGKTNVELEKEKDDRKSAYVLFSPNSQKFTMTRSDNRKVKDLWVINSAAKPRPTLETYKYQMAGEKDAPQVDVLVFDFPSKSMVKMKDDLFKDQQVGLFSARRLKKNRDDKRNPRLWLSKMNDRVYFSRTSRDMKRIDICEANANTGEVKVRVAERLNTYVEMTTPIFVNGESEMIHWSERDGWAHAYLIGSNGEVKTQLTRGPWHVDGLESVDEKSRQLYFRANGREAGEDPYYYHHYKVGLDGSGLTLLDKGNYSHAASGNDGYSYFVDNFSRVNTAPRSVLRDRTGNVLMNLEEADLSQLMQTGYRFPEPFMAKAGDGVTDIYGVMYKPYDFDSTKVYPLIEYVYPGPQTEAVGKTFSARMDRTDRLAQFGFVVITLGNRGGHPDRSKWYHNYGYGNLRDYGLEDKKVVAEQMAMRHSFIDLDKVGIFGHSGGAFMSTAAMLVYPKFFKVAVSSSGNHDNSVYNRWWSEKHHGVKEVISEEGDTTFVYKIENNQSLAKNLQGKLMITTGEIDNNVHPAGTVRMANALIKAGKRFDYFLFPQARHGYGSMNEYFFWLRSDYFVKHLMGDKEERPVDMW